MKTLLLMRHAKSSWKDDTLDDHERPLNKRGRRAAPAMGAMMAERGMMPDLILSSTAARARDTARRVALALGYRGDTLLTDELYLASAEEMIAAARRAPDVSTVLMVGHNPGTEDLFAMLSGRDDRFVTAALAEVRFPCADWQGAHPSVAECRGFWVPRDLE